MPRFHMTAVLTLGWKQEYFWGIVERLWRCF